MSMNGDKDSGQSSVMIRLTERQETISKEAKKATGVSLGSLIRKCIDINVEYLRKLTINPKDKD
ncbi:MAG: hypothetical protein OXP71_09680 [Candidatus Poribacteria bacterium]|nr:hypothetical protein [Candidatus Poribacteria bacterium]